ncbi:MAG TPA: TAXI family TRAP transporter solute-binding subunit, partial [Azospirillaceae bacterium]|nr:TAXI family TRAP transporter solute-binding subunit [Azospirillaceae bacterium]
GPAGSGPRSLFEQVMERMGWKPGSFSAVTELPPEEQAAALCAGRFDAMFYAVAHPNGGVLAAAAECETTFVPVAGEAVDALAAEKSWLVKTAIPGNLYPGAAEPVPTVGVAATLVTTAGLPEAAAYQIAKSVMEDLGALTAQHPALAGLERETMVRAGLTAPLHPGAERYYREAGLL